jgi:drug/metabolite transporter, DME family
MHLPVVGWAILLAWAWIPTVLAYGLYLLALKRIEASRATIICTIEPVSAIALACLFLGETVSVPQLMGAALVLAGVIIVAITPSLARSAAYAVET